MKKYRRGLRLAACLLALATCAVLLCSCLHPGKADSYTAAMPVIVVGSDNYPPFNYMGTDGAPTGIDVELATEAFGRLGVAFAKERGDDLPQQLTEVFREMLADGTVRQIVSRYLDDPGHYLDGLEDSTHA